MANNNLVNFVLFTGHDRPFDPRASQLLKSIADPGPMAQSIYRTAPLRARFADCSLGDAEFRTLEYVTSGMHFIGQPTIVIGIVSIENFRSFAHWIETHQDRASDEQAFWCEVPKFWRVFTIKPENQLEGEIIIAEASGQLLVARPSERHRPATWPVAMIPPLDRPFNLQAA